MICGRETAQVHMENMQTLNKNTDSQTSCCEVATKPLLHSAII